VKRFFIPNKENKYKPLLLRKVALVIYTLILLFVNTFGGLLGIPQAMASSISPANIIQLTNQQRTAAGLNTLTSNAKLTAAAQAKANNMFEVQYWDHYGPNGETPWMFISQAGYTYVYAGENLAKGFRTAEGVHEAWMASPTHKENIMSVNYKEIGVAVVEGTLLGKETILVVQMFGNQTNQIYKPTISAPSTPTPPPAKPIVPEKGEIKSIKITNPKPSDLLNDANVNIKGETENTTGEYTVEILKDQEIVGETKSNTKEWEFDKESDWSEGEQIITATLKGENIKSEPVLFTIDSTPPIILQETIKVKKIDENYELSFFAPEDAVELKFITGDKTYDIEVALEQTVSINIPKEDIGERSLLMASDKAGNIAEKDISEYFLKEVKGEEHTSPIILGIKNIFGTTDGISLSIIAFVFILLSIQVYYSWKNGKLGRNVGDLFTIGAWWLIVLVGVFKGFGGLIN
jgi:hypothetical protein